MEELHGRHSCGTRGPQALTLETLHSLIDLFEMMQKGVEMGKQSKKAKKEKKGKKGDLQVQVLDVSGAGVLLSQFADDSDSVKLAAVKKAKKKKKPGREDKSSAKGRGKAAAEDAGAMVEKSGTSGKSGKSKKKADKGIELHMSEEASDSSQVTGAARLQSKLPRGIDGFKAKSTDHMVSHRDYDEELITADRVKEAVSGKNYPDSAAAPKKVTDVKKTYGRGSRRRMASPVTVKKMPEQELLDEQLSALKHGDLVMLLKQAQEVRARLVDENGRLQTEISHLRKSQAEDAEKNARIAKEANDLKGVNARLETEKVKLEATVAKLEGERRGVIGGKASLAREKANFEEESKRFEETLAQVEEQRKMLEAERADIAKQREAIDSERSRIQEVNGQIEKARATLEEARKKLASEQARFEEEREAFVKGMVKAPTEMAALQVDNASAVVTVDSLFGVVEEVSNEADCADCLADEQQTVASESDSDSAIEPIAEEPLAAEMPGVDGLAEENISEKPDTDESALEEQAAEEQPISQEDVPPEDQLQPAASCED